MRTFVPFILSVAAIVAALCSLIELRSSWALNSSLHREELTYEALRSLGSGVASSTAATADQNIEEVASFEEMSSMPFQPARADFVAVRRLEQLGRVEQNQNRKIELYCRALNRLGEALAREPLNARALISWADIRQMLGAIECGLTRTAGDYQKTVEYALSVDPLNTDVVFDAAQILWWGGEIQRSQELFKQFLSYATELTPAQTSFILTRISEFENFQNIVPARLPQLTEWLERIAERDPGFIKRNAAGIEPLQRSSLENNLAEFKSESVTSAIYYGRLMAMLSVVASSTVRQSIDSELVKYFALVGNRDASEFLSERKRYADIELVHASLSGDTRPAKSSFSNWQSSEEVTVNQFYQSVGFFLPAGQTLKLIELVSARQMDVLSPNYVKIFVSDDNRVWQDITDSVEAKSFSLDGEAHFSLKVPAVPHSFWKIHFANAVRNGNFRNRLDRLVRGYGFSTVSR